MLEEALNNNSADPAETARAILNYLQYELPAGGPDSEYRFCQSIYPLLLSRTFGFLDTKDKKLRHLHGGWLSKVMRWNSSPYSSSSQMSPARSRPKATPTRSVYSSQGQRSSSMSIKSDPVVYLLSPPPTSAGPVANETRGKMGIVAGALSQSRISGSSNTTAGTIGGPTLFSIMSKESQVRPTLQYAFPFRALPESSQKLFLHIIESKLVAQTNTRFTTISESELNFTDNQIHLYSSLLTKSPLQQKSVIDLCSEVLKSQQLRIAQQNHSPVGYPARSRNQFSPQSLQYSSSPRQSSAMLLRQPGKQPKTPPLDSTEGEKLQKQASECTVLLSMIEFYFFLFLRYPWVKPQPPQPSSFRSRNSAAGIYGSTSSPSTMPNSDPYGETVYLYLFQSYVQYYLRRLQDPAFDVPIEGTKSITSTSELFLRILIDFWLDGHNLPLSNPQLIQKFQIQSSRQFSSTSPLEGGLSVAFDNVELGSDYIACPTLIVRSMQYLVGYLCGDFALEQSIRKLREDSASQLLFIVSNMQNRPLSSILTPSMTALQQPLFNYLRVTLKNASFTPAARGAESPFSTAVTLWLTWLEPWNFISTSKFDFVSQYIAPFTALSHLNMDFTISSESATSSSMAKDRLFSLAVHVLSSTGRPKPTAPSKYSSFWASYIAANTHFYATLFAIFIRRARDLDFSPNGGAFERSLALLQQVFRVYTPEVLEVVNLVLGVDAVMDQTTGNGTAASNQLEAHLKLEHDKILGTFCPMGKMNMQDCARDVQILLEEIYVHHLKKVGEMGFLDRFEDRLNSLSGIGTKQERQAIDALKDKAKIVAGSPPDFDDAFAAPSSSMARSKRWADSSMKDRPDTSANGLLTEKGREDLATGRRALRPQDVRYVGDPMFARVRTYEIGFLVKWTVWASLWLNLQLGNISQADFKVLDAQIHNDRSNFVDMLKEKDIFKHQRYRVNLRGLADYRNLLFILMLLALVKLAKMISDLMNGVSLI